jgi:dUTP pyrophosphatase
VKVLLVNLGNEPFTVTRGMRVAQLIFAPVAQATMQKVSSLDGTERGEAGFGSTGLSKRAAG